MRKKSVTDAHAAFRAALMATVREHAAHLPPDEILAVASNFVGKIIGLLDQRKYTPDRALALVLANIRAGNETNIGALRDAPAAGNA